MRLRVNIKYSLISESPNLPVAKAMDVSRIVWSGGMVLTQRRREAESAEIWNWYVSISRKERKERKIVG